MKKIILITLILLTTTIQSSFAATKTTPTPSVTPTANEIPTDTALEKIQHIKSVVASKVAELNLVEKRGILGKIKEKSNTQLTIEDIKGQIRIIDIDELTKFAQDTKSTSKESSFGVTDLKNDTYYSFIGLYNKETKRLMGRFISEVKTIPVYFEGVVAEINATDFTLTVFNEKGDKKTIDIGKTTKTFVHSKPDDLTKSGFSKIEMQQRIFVVGFLDLKDKNLIEATRVIHFSDLPPSKKALQYVSANDEAITATGSGKKLEILQKVKATQ